MSDGGYGESPPRQRLYRISTLKDFLPLSDDSVFPNRGHRLPALIQSRSSANISSRWQRARRRSSVGENAPWRAHEGGGEGGNLDDTGDYWDDYHDRRMSNAANVLMTPQMRSQRLIGNSNPRYKWEKYWKTEEQLKQMPKKIRQYYERCNYLVQRYLYIDRLLDSSLPHSLIQEYQQVNGPPGAASSPDVPTITEELTPTGTPTDGILAANGTANKVKRTPKDIYRINKDDVQPTGTANDESTPLLQKTASNGDEEALPLPPDLGEEEEEETSSQSRIVTIAIIVNTIANTLLLAMKVAVAVLTNSVSVLASLVDAALDWLSTIIIWTTTHLIANTDQYAYPIGRRRLEPVGVMVFAVIMVSEALERDGHVLLSGPHFRSE